MQAAVQRVQEAHEEQRSERVPLPHRAADMNIRSGAMCAPHRRHQSSHRVLDEVDEGGRHAETTQREHFDLLSGLMDAAEKDPDDKMRITEDEMYCASRRAVVDPILTSPLSQLCCDAVCVVVAQRCCDGLNSCSLNRIAGHETSAHSLSFVLGELAANPEVQARLHQHILDNLPERGAMPV